MKKIIGIFLIATCTIIYSCGGDTTNSTPAPVATTPDPVVTPDPVPGTDNPVSDPKRGMGKFSDVKLGATLDAAMASKGEKTAELKCYSCHKVSDERLVGPGWQGVTARHSPEWIMNFMTNPDEMLDKDPKAQAMLELCMVRMPNQDLQDEEARQLLEFMRKNDGVK